MKTTEENYYYSSYEKPLLIGDLNTETSETHIDSFVYEHELHNLMKKNIFQKNAQNYLKKLKKNKEKLFSADSIEKREKTFLIS